MAEKHVRTENDRIRDKINGGAYYLVNKEKVLTRQKERYHRIREQYLKQQTEYRSRPEVKLRNHIYAREYRLKKRRELLNLLGDKCAKCGFSNLVALEIDHIDGGGTADKKRIAPKSQSSHNMYMYYLKRPELAKQTLQLLCRNCNRIKQYENHEQPYFGDVL